MNDSASASFPANVCEAAAEVKKPANVTPTWMVAKNGWNFGELEDALSALIALLCHFADLVVVQGDDCDLRRCEKRIDQDQDNQQDNGKHREG